MSWPDRVGQVLAAGRRLGLDRLDAQLLLGHHLTQRRTWLVAHDDAAVDERAARAFLHDAARRVDGVPLAYLTGRREFHGLTLSITPEVLDPRPDTETVVDWALALIDPTASPRVLDLGTGSGAIALAICRARPNAEVHALDSSGPALDVARGNAAEHSLQVEFHRGDWWAGWKGGRVDLAVSNPPYIADGDPHLTALSHEPRQALVAGADGLHALRRIVADASEHLAPGAWLLLEHGHEQAGAVVDLLHAAGFGQTTTRGDLAGRDRASGGRWLPRGAALGRTGSLAHSAAKTSSPVGPRRA